MNFFDTEIVNRYKEIAALAAEYELRVRLLANKMNLSWTSDLKDVEKAIIKQFQKLLNEDDEKTLEDTRRLRNKFLHGAFNAVTELMQEKGVRINTGSVTCLDLTTRQCISPEKNMFFDLLILFLGGGIEPLIEEFEKGIKIITELTNQE